MIKYQKITQFELLPSDMSELFDEMPGLGTSKTPEKTDAIPKVNKRKTRKNKGGRPKRGFIPRSR